MWNECKSCGLDYDQCLCEKCVKCNKMKSLSNLYDRNGLAICDKCLDAKEQNES